MRFSTHLNGQCRVEKGQTKWYIFVCYAIFDLLNPEKSTNFPKYQSLTLDIYHWFQQTNSNTLLYMIKLIFSTVFSRGPLKHIFMILY